MCCVEQKQYHQPSKRWQNAIAPGSNIAQNASNSVTTVIHVHHYHHITFENSLTINHCNPSQGYVSSSNVAAVYPRVVNDAIIQNVTNSAVQTAATVVSDKLTTDLSSQNHVNVNNPTTNNITTDATSNVIPHQPEPFDAVETHSNHVQSPTTSYSSDKKRQLSINTDEPRAKRQRISPINQKTSIPDLPHAASVSKSDSHKRRRYTVEFKLAVIAAVEALLEDFQYVPGGNSVYYTVVNDT